MRITDIERIMLRVPFTERLLEWNRLDHNVWNWQVIEVIRLRTSNGLVGYGETLPHYGWGVVPPDAEERVVGRHPIEFLQDDSVGPGLQMAIYDVLGKAMDVPASTLIGPRVREWTPIAWWNGEIPVSELAAEAADAVAAGYAFGKFKARPWLDIYQQIEVLAATTPAYFRLDMDWNAMLLTAGDAMPLLRWLDEQDQVAIYETPIPHADLEGYRVLRSKVAKPLAVHLKNQPFPSWIESAGVDGFVMEGGIAAMKHRDALAGEFAKNHWLQMVGCGLTTALCAHLGSVLPYARWPAVTCLNNYADDLLRTPLTIRDGYLKVPDGPGLGVEVDEDALRRYRIDPPYELPRRRHLISVSWPSGRRVHYVDTKSQMWADFLAGNHPVAEPGVAMDVRVDDGSNDFAELWERARRQPVYDRSA